MNWIRSLIACLLLIQAKAQRNIKPSPDNCALFSNEEFEINVRRCQNTCNFYGRTWDCDSYRPHGDCYCKNGFARLYDNYGPCVDVSLNEECAASLPISPDSCILDNEEYVEELYSQDVSPCSKTCEGLFLPCNVPTYYVQWGPHCECKSGFYRTISGNCVLYDDSECVAEYQPSASRCPKMGKVYVEDPTCVPTCYAGQETVCYSGPSCVCPEGSIMKAVDNDQCIDISDCIQPTM